MKLVLMLVAADHCVLLAKVPTKWQLAVKKWSWADNMRMIGNAFTMNIPVLLDLSRASFDWLSIGVLPRYLDREDDTPNGTDESGIGT